MGVDVNEGASQIAQMLQPRQPSDSALEVEGDDIPTEAEQVEAVETTETETESETPTEEESDTETKYKVKVGGEEQEVTLNDLRKGYMMESDYRKKTSEVARQREEAQQKLEKLTENLNDAELLLKIEVEDLSSAENQELKEIDPTAYYEKREAIEAKKGKLEALKKEINQANQKKQQQFLNREIELVYQSIPEWLDQDTFEADSKAMSDMYTAMGIPESLLNSRNTHFDVIVARKAALYDKLMSAKPESKKITPKPKAASPSASKPSDGGEVVKMARKKLSQTGKMNDAAAAIKQLMR